MEKVKRSVDSIVRPGLRICVIKFGVAAAGAVLRLKETWANTVKLRA